MSNSSPGKMYNRVEKGACDCIKATLGNNVSMDGIIGHILVILSVCPLEGSEEGYVYI